MTRAWAANGSSAASPGSFRCRNLYKGASGASAVSFSAQPKKITRQQRKNLRILLQGETVEESAPLNPKPVSDKLLCRMPLYRPHDAARLLRVFGPLEEIFFSNDCAQGE